jgi:PAS domain S-box-containing protein
MARPKVLYVDDEPALLELTKIFLSDHFDIDTEENPSKVLDRLQNTKYDVLISDFQMPRLDGIMLLKELRGRGDRIPFILFTGKGREEVAMDALNNGADFYLQKGGDPNVQFRELRNAILHLNNRSQMESSLVQSENRYRDLVESSNTIILKMTLDGRITYMNRCGRRFFEMESLAEGELAETIAFDLVTSFEFVKDRIKFLLANPIGIANHSNTYPMTLKNGRDVWVSWSVSIIRNEAGEISELLIFGTDVTAAKNGEMELQRSMSLTRASLDTSDEGIIVLANDRTVLEHNSRYAEMWEIPYELPGKLSKENVRRHLREKLRFPEQHIEHIDRCAQDPAAEGTFTIELLDGRIFEEYTTPFRIGQEIVGRYWSYKDITKMKRTEQELIESEERFRNLSENAFEGIVITIDGVIIDTNEALCHLTGYTSEELKGRSALDFLTKASAPTVLEQEGTPSTAPYEVQIICKDGRVLDAQIRDRFSNWRGTKARIGAVQDITERKQAEEQHSRLLEAIPDFVIVTDISGQISFVNKWALERSGYSKEDIIGKNVFAFIVPEDVALAVENMRQMIEGRLGPVEYRLMMKDGSLVRFEANGDVIRGPNGGSIDVVLIGRDITEHHRLEKSLREANSKLRILTSITRHDTLNKLMVIRGTLELDRRATDNPFMIRHIDKINQMVELLVEQADFIKDYQNMGASYPGWQSVQDVFGRAALRFGWSEVQFDVRAGGATIIADPMLEKVFYNLIDNSMKHGDKVKKITVEIKVIDRDLIISYQDDGVGIPAQDRDHLFEEGHGKDHGLGLYLAKEILAITDITIAETGPPGGGVCFEIRVPEGSYALK